MVQNNLYHTKKELEKYCEVQLAVIMGKESLSPVEIEQYKECFKGKVMLEQFLLELETVEEDVRYIGNGVAYDNLKIVFNQMLT